MSEEEKGEKEVVEVKKGVYVWKGYEEWREKFPFGKKDKS